MASDRRSMAICGWGKKLALVLTAYAAMTMASVRAGCPSFCNTQVTISTSGDTHIGDALLPSCEQVSFRRPPGGPASFWVSPLPQGFHWRHINSFKRDVGRAHRPAGMLAALSRLAFFQPQTASHLAHDTLLHQTKRSPADAPNAWRTLEAVWNLGHVTSI